MTGVQTCALPISGTTIGSSPNDTIYSFVVNATSGEWEHWAKRVPSWKPPQGNLGAAFGSILVPTIDSTCCQYNIELALSQERPVLLIGGPGTAKTSTVLQFLARQDQATTVSKKLSFSSATTPLIFQRQVENSVEKRQGGKLIGYIRIRSKTQGIALSLGDKITLKQKAASLKE